MPKLALLALAFGTLSTKSQAANLYFDTNGATAGSGVLASGTYSWTAGTNWSTSSAGTTATASWTGGSDAIFTAGADATGLAFTSTLTNGTTTTANSLTLNSGGALTIMAGSSSSLVITSGTISVASSGTVIIGVSTLLKGASGLTKEGGGLLSIPAVSGNVPQYTGDTTVNAGIFSGRLPTATLSRLVVNNSGVFRNANVTNNTAAGISSTSTTAVIEGGSSVAVTMTISNTANLTESYAGIIRNGSTGALSLTKDGAYVQRLSGSNSYTGTTTVTAGTLLVNGNNSSATGAVSAAAGAILGGTGTIGGATTVTGTLAPGDSSTSNLTLASLTLNSGAVSNFEISGTGAGTFDSITSAGSMALGSSTLNLIFSVNLADNSSIDLFLGAGSLSGNFGGVNLVVTGGTYIAGSFTNAGGLWTSAVQTGGQTLTFNAATGVLTAVPEPSQMALMAFALGIIGLAARRRSRQPALK